MTPEEFLAAVAAIHKYLMEAKKPPEIKSPPVMWKMGTRLIQ